MDYWTHHNKKFSSFLNLTVVLFDIITYTVLLAIVGVVVAWVMGMGKKEA